jgi:hypothetical protein
MWQEIITYSIVVLAVAYFVQQIFPSKSKKDKSCQSGKCGCSSKQILTNK